MTPLPPHGQLVGSQFSIVPPFFPFWRRLASLHSLRPPLPSPASDKSWLSLSTVAWHLTSWFAFFCHYLNMEIRFSRCALESLKFFKDSVIWLKSRKNFTCGTSIDFDPHWNPAVPSTRIKTNVTRHKRSVDEVKNDSKAIHVSPKHLKTRKEIEINKCTNCLARVVSNDSYKNKWLSSFIFNSQDLICTPPHCRGAENLVLKQLIIP